MEARLLRRSGRGQPSDAPQVQDLHGGRGRAAPPPPIAADAATHRLEHHYVEALHARQERADRAGPRDEPAIARAARGEGAALAHIAIAASSSRLPPNMSPATPMKESGSERRQP
eukprot:10217634-Lingulodinium_polyedra.AAC.1